MNVGKASSVVANRPGRSGVLTGLSELDFQKIWPAHLEGRSFKVPARSNVNGPILRKC